ncbi:MAG TPA: protoporphyrinogen oxidase [Acidimicrobiia bacterium]
MVVGGGLAGLFTASELTARDIDVVVLEESPVAGGVARTIEKDGFALEPAVGSFSLPHPHLTPLLDRAGVATAVAVQASIRYVYAEGRLVAIPGSPKALLVPVLGIKSKLRVLFEPLVPACRTDDDESLAEFFRRRLGEQAGGLVSWLMATGVYAGDPGRLSVGAAFPALAELERTHGSVIKGAIRRRRARPSNQAGTRVHVPEGDVSGLIDAIGGQLGDRFYPGFAVRSLRREGQTWIVEGPERITADAAVLAIGPNAAADLVDGELGAALAECVAAPTAVVFLGGRGPSPLPDGFGALVGPGEGWSTRGVLFESAYAPSRAPEGCWLAKVIVGGVTAPSVVDRDDERLIPEVVSEVEAIFGVRLVPDVIEVVRHRPGIPQYEVGHRRWLAGVERLLAAEPGLHLTGWGYRGVGIANLATDAVRVADAVTRS